MDLWLKGSDALGVKTRDARKVEKIRVVVRKPYKQKFDETDKKVARMRTKEMIETARQSVGRNRSHDRASARRLRTSMGLFVILSLLSLALNKKINKSRE